MSKKYSLFSEQRVKQGIVSGEFSVTNIALVRDGVGSIVKHMKGSGEGLIPPSIVQINHNTIYEADMGQIVNALIRERNAEVADGLADQYKLVLDNLAYYRDHGERLNDLNSKSLDASSVFESRIDRFIDTIDSFRKDGRRNIKIIDSYVNVIFVYVMSGYWLLRGKFRNDSTSRNKLSSLEGKVRELYQELLIAKNCDEFALRDSVYAHLYLDKDSDIKLIDRLVKHDSRCNSSLDFFESYRNKCIEKKWKNGGSSYTTSKSDDYASNVDSRLELALGLYEILEKIHNINNIIDELTAAGKIDESQIDVGLDAIQSPLAIFRIESKSQEPDK